MSIPYTELFAVIGFAGGMHRNIEGMVSNLGTTASAAHWSASSNGALVNNLPTNLNNILSEISSTNASDIAYLKDIYTTFSALQTSITSASVTFFQAWVQNYFIGVVNAAVPQSSPTLANCMKALIAAMPGASKSVAANTVSATVTAGGSNVGNDILLATLYRPDGYISYLALPDNITFTCTQDATTGKVAAGSETLSYSSPSLSYARAFDYSWPGANAGTSGTITPVDWTTNASTQGNLLTNSGFETFPSSGTLNTPTGWAIAVGTDGTTILKDTTNLHSSLSTASLRIVGNGTELTSITQKFGNTTGTNIKLQASTVYAFNCWVYVPSETITTGVLKIDLVQGSSLGSLSAVTGPNSYTNAVSTTLSGLATTTWTAVNGFFITPVSLPTVPYYLRISLSTALNSAEYISIDDLCMTPVSVRTTTGGPGIVLFRSTTDLLLNDSYTLVVANSSSGYYGTETAGLMQTTFEVFFGMRGMGLQLPTSGSPTIADTLVT